MLQTLIRVQVERSDEGTPASHPRLRNRRHHRRHDRLSEPSCIPRKPFFQAPVFDRRLLLLSDIHRTRRNQPSLSNSHRSQQMALLDVRDLPFVPPLQRGNHSPGRRFSPSVYVLLSLTLG